MTSKGVRPAALQYGDRIYVNGHEWFVKDIQGPDNAGAYDLYLTDGRVDTHEVIVDTVTVIY